MNIIFWSEFAENPGNLVINKYIVAFSRRKKTSIYRPYISGTFPPSAYADTCRDKWSSRAVFGRPVPVCVSPPPPLRAVGAGAGVAGGLIIQSRVGRSGAGRQSAVGGGRWRCSVL